MRADVFPLNELTVPVGDGTWSEWVLGAGLTLAFAVGIAAGAIAKLRRRDRDVRQGEALAAYSRRGERWAVGALCGLLAADAVALMLAGSTWLAAAYVALGIAPAVAWMWSRGRDASLWPEPPSPTSSAPDALEGDATAPQPQRSDPARGRRGLGYVCVGRDAMGRELPTHTRAIQDWASANRVRIVEVVHDIERDSGPRGPAPALHWALERLAAGDADVLVTARLEHLSPTVAELSPLLDWFTSRERTVVAIDFRLDTATAAGRLAATALAGVGGWERARLSARTRRGLEAARARGSRNGRAAVADVPELRERIARMRGQGMTLQAIADVLNDEGVATLRGGAKWRPSSVQRATGYQRPASARPDMELPGPMPVDGPGASGEAPARRA
jgi:DNA invertase Pin-like site-specific DNA recombinase